MYTNDVKYKQYKPLYNDNREQTFIVCMNTRFSVHTGTLNNLYLYLYLYRDRWRAHVNVVMNLQIP